MLKYILFLTMLALPAQAITTTSQSNTVGDPSKSGDFSAYRVDLPFGATGTYRHIVDIKSAFKIPRGFFATAYCYYCQNGFTVTFDVNGSSTTRTINRLRTFYYGVRGEPLSSRLNPSDVATITFEITDPIGQTEYPLNQRAPYFGGQLIAAPVPASGGFLAAAMAFLGWRKMRSKGLAARAA